MNASVKGVFAAIVTPIGPNFLPDHAKLIDLAQDLLGNGCDGLNVLGTTGEATSFSVQDRVAVMEAVARRLPVNRLLVGTGAAAVADAVRLSKSAAQLGFSGALLLPPFYYKGVADSGVVDYVGAVVEATHESQLPIYLYNYPALSGVPYTEALVGALLQRFGARIAGLKDSSGDLAYARRVAALPGKLAVFPSNEGALLEARAGLFAGCISATANLNAALCSKAYHEGDEAALHKAVAIRKLLTDVPLIPGIKSLLAAQRADPRIAAVMPPLSGLRASDEKSLHENFRSIA